MGRYPLYIKPRKTPELKHEEVELPIKEITGKESDKKTNKKILDDLRNAVMAAQHFGDSPRTYTPYQILSFAEYALWFIRAEFYEQAGVVTAMIFLLVLTLLVQPTSATSLSPA